MFDFDDLARSGTAPNCYPKQGKYLDCATFHKETEVLRPKTRDFTGNSDLSELNTSLRMNRRKASDSSKVHDYPNEMIESFRITQSNSEFLSAVDQMRQPTEGHCVDRRLAASVGIRKADNNLLGEGNVEEGSRQSYPSADRFREVRKEATPKFLSRHSLSSSSSRTSSSGNDGYGIAIDSTRVVVTGDSSVEKHRSTTPGPPPTSGPEVSGHTSSGYDDDGYEDDSQNEYESDDEVMQETAQEEDIALDGFVKAASRAGTGCAPSSARTHLKVHVRRPASTNTNPYAKDSAKFLNEFAPAGIDIDKDAAPVFKAGRPESRKLYLAAAEASSSPHTGTGASSSARSPKKHTGPAPSPYLGGASFLSAKDRKNVRSSSSRGRLSSETSTLPTGAKAGAAGAARRVDKARSAGDLRRFVTVPSLVTPAACTVPARERDRVAEKPVATATQKKGILKKDKEDEKRNDNERAKEREGERDLRLMSPTHPHSASSAVSPLPAAAEKPAPQSLRKTQSSRALEVFPTQAQASTRLKHTALGWSERTEGAAEESMDQIGEGKLEEVEEVYEMQKSSGEWDLVKDRDRDKWERDRGERDKDLGKERESLVTRSRGVSLEPEAYCLSTHFFPPPTSMSAPSSRSPVTGGAKSPGGRLKAGSRPPSRQKVGAQHLFHTEEGEETPALSPAPRRFSVTHSGRNGRTTQDPISDGFAALNEHCDLPLPFRIEVNYGDCNAHDADGEKGGEKISKNIAVKSVPKQDGSSEKEKGKEKERERDGEREREKEREKDGDRDSEKDRDKDSSKRWLSDLATDPLDRLEEGVHRRLNTQSRGSPSTTPPGGLFLPSPTQRTAPGVPFFRSVLSPSLLCPSPGAALTPHLVGSGCSTPGAFQRERGGDRDRGGGSMAWSTPRISPTPLSLSLNRMSSCSSVFEAKPESQSQSKGTPLASNHGAEADWDCDEESALSVETGDTDSSQDSDGETLNFNLESSLGEDFLNLFARGI